MAKGINAVYTEKPTVEVINDDEDILSEDPSRATNDALLNRL